MHRKGVQELFHTRERHALNENLCAKVENTYCK